MDWAQLKDSSQYVCAVCRASADVWCHNDEVALCKRCDTQIHSEGPLAWAHRRTPLPQLKCGEDAFMTTHQGGHSMHDHVSAKRSRESCQLQEVCHGHDACPRPAEHELDESLGHQLLGTDDFPHLDWNPPEMVSSLANESFEVNVFELDEIFGGFENVSRPWDTSAPPLLKTSPADPGATCNLTLPPHKASRQVIGAGRAAVESYDTIESSTSAWLPHQDPVNSTTADEPSAPLPAHAPEASASGPPRVPSPSMQGFRHSPSLQSLQSFEQFPPAPADPMGAPAPVSPAAGAAPAAPSHPAGPHLAMPMMPYYMPQQMMDPSMMWGGGGCYMPMFQQHMWATYIPASLLPKGDPMIYEARMQERRAKRARFQEKKRQLSCRKAVRYASRKRYADSRPRVNGRFISKAAAAASAAAP